MDTVGHNQLDNASRPRDLGETSNQPEKFSVLHVLEGMQQLINSARAVPMTRNCVVNREQISVFIVALQASIPDQLAQADALHREAVASVEVAYQEAESIIVKAKQTADALASREQIVQRATVKARDLLARSENQAEALRRESDQYVIRSLQEFETQLDLMRSQAERGKALVSERMRLRGTGKSSSGHGTQVAAISRTAGANSLMTGGEYETGTLRKQSLLPGDKAAASVTLQETLDGKGEAVAYVKSEGPNTSMGRRAQW